MNQTDQSISDAREKCRQIDATYFHAQPTRRIRIARLVAELLDHLTRLKELQTARVTPLIREQAFSVLTHDCYEALEELRARLHDVLGTSQQLSEVQISSAATDSRLQAPQAQIRYLKNVIATVIEGIQKCESRRRPLDRSQSCALTEADLFNLEDLKDLLNAFFRGCPDTDLYGNPPPLPRRAISQLQSDARSADGWHNTVTRKTQQAMPQSLTETQQGYWRLRHSLYWYYRSFEGLQNIATGASGGTGRRNSQESSQILRRIMMTFFDGIKSAWLVQDIAPIQYDEMNVILQQVVLLMRQKILDHLRNYYVHFMIPDYDIIHEEDPKIAMPAIRSAPPRLEHNMFNLPGSTAQNMSFPYSANTMFSQPVASSRNGSRSATEYGAPYQIAENTTPYSGTIDTNYSTYNGDHSVTQSPATYYTAAFPPNPTDGVAQEGRLHRGAAPPMSARPEAVIETSHNLQRTRTPDSFSSNNWRAPHTPPMPPLPLHPIPYRVRQDSNRNGTSPIDLPSPPARPSIPDDRRSSSSMQRDRSSVGSEGRDQWSANMHSSPPSVRETLGSPRSNESEFHRYSSQSTDETVLLPGETEINNPEQSTEQSQPGGFFNVLSSRERTDWIPSRVRVFRRDSSDNLRVWTDADSQPPHSVEINPHEAEIVPIYAWTDRRNEGSELYLRQHGRQHGLYYKFITREHQTEVYGFQSVLMSSKFETQLGVRSVRIEHPQHPIEMLNALVQLWTPENEQTLQKSNIEPNIGIKRSVTLQSQWSSDTASARVEDLRPQSSCSRVCFYHDNKVTIILLTEYVRIEYVFPPKQGILRNQPKPTTARILASRDHNLTHVRAITLRPSIGEYAGLPLGHAGLQVQNQFKDNFGKYDHIDIDFYKPDNCTYFVHWFKKLQKKWEAKYAPYDQYRAFQRSHTVEVRSVTKPAKR